MVGGIALSLSPGGGIQMLLGVEGGGERGRGCSGSMKDEREVIYSQRELSAEWKAMSKRSFFFFFFNSHKEL